MTKFYSIPLETANKLVDYLLKRPYHEVAELINELNSKAVMLEAPANLPDKDELIADRIESGNLITESPTEVE